MAHLQLHDINDHRPQHHSKKPTEDERRFVLTHKRNVLIFKNLDEIRRNSLYSKLYPGFTCCQNEIGFANKYDSDIYQKHFQFGSLKDDPPANFNNAAELAEPVRPRGHLSPHAIIIIGTDPGIPIFGESSWLYGPTSTRLRSALADAGCNERCYFTDVFKRPAMEYQDAAQKRREIARAVEECQFFDSQPIVSFGKNILDAPVFKPILDEIKNGRRFLNLPHPSGNNRSWPKRNSEEYQRNDRCY